MKLSDLGIEIDILSTLIKDTNILAEYYVQLKEELFNDIRSKQILKSIFYVYKKYNGLLNLSKLEKLLQDNNVTEEKRTTYVLFFQEIEAKNITKDEFDISFNLLKKYYYRREIYKLVEQTAENLERESETTILSNLSKKASELLSVNNEVIYEKSILDSVYDRLTEYKDRRDHPEKFKGFSYGIDAFDNLTGGVFKSELGLIFGRSGTGKSRLLSNIAFNVFRQNKNVLYFTIEMPASQMGRIYDSNAFRVSYTGLKYGHLNKTDEERYFHWMSQKMDCSGDLIIIDVPRGCTTDLVLSKIRQYKHIKEIDLVIVDYINIMKYNGILHSREERLGEITKELKEIARLENIAVFTAAQAAREVKKMEGKQDFGTEHIGYSDAIGHHCDVIFYIDKGGNENRIMNALDLYAVKLRDKATEKSKILVNWDFNIIDDYILNNESLKF